MQLDRREDGGPVKLHQTICMLVLLLASTVPLAGQTRQFTRDGIEYILELPSPAWQVVSRLDVHDHAEFINGNDQANGYLRVRKVLVKSLCQHRRIVHSGREMGVAAFAGIRDLQRM